MVYDSISFGLIVFNGFLEPAEVPPSTGTPSITNNGLLLADNEAPPLILIVEPLPGAPPPYVICTPATLPVNIWSGDTIKPLFSSLDFTDVTEPVASLTVVVP